HRLHRVALEPVLAATQITGDDGKGHGFGEACKVALGAESQWAQDREIAFIIQQFRWHRRKASAVEEVEEERLENIFTMVAKDQRRTAFLPRNALKVASAKTRAQRTVGLALGDLFGHDGIGVAVFDPVRNAMTLEKFRQYVLGKVRLT